MEFEPKPSFETSRVNTRNFLDILAGKINRIIDAITPKNPEDFPLYSGGIFPQDIVSYYLRQVLTNFDPKKPENGQIEH